MMELINLGIKLKDYRVGNQKTLCPKCSHTRKNKTDLCLSVTIKYDGAVWFCHNCGWNTGIGNKKEYRIPQFVKKELPPATLTWLTKRGITEEVVRRNNISYGEHFIPAKGKKVTCLQFPYYRDGMVVNVKYRTGDKCFAQEKDAEKVYYGIDDIKKFDTVIICEGEIDKLSLEVAGYLNCVSVPDGAPKQVKEPSEEDAKFSYVWNCWKEFEGKKIIIAVDTDEPGEALAEELSRRYGKDRCCRVKWSMKDANETLIEQGVDNVVYYIENALPYPVQGLYTASDVANEAILFYDEGAKPGISTGWSSMDEFMTIRTGELTIISGVPSSGKSEFVDAMMVNISMNYGWNFAICSFENPSKIHLGKLCEKYLDRPFNRGYSERMTKQEFIKAIANWASKHFSFIISDGIDDSPTIDWILERAKIAVARYGIKGLVIDPYNEIEHKRPSNQTETEYVSEMLRKVKKFAQMYGVHVWFIAHPAKMRRDASGNYPVPTLYDISGSANFFNKTDLGVIVHRKNPADIYANTEIYIQKARFKENGKVGMVELKYDRRTGRYSSL